MIDYDAYMTAQYGPGWEHEPPETREDWSKDTPCPGCGHRCCPTPSLECGGESDTVRECEAPEQPEPVGECAECDDPYSVVDSYGMCASCLHDAFRSGWLPGMTD